MTAGVVSDVASLDARLAGLDELFDNGAMARRFEQAGAGDVLECTMLGVRYEPGASCTATYALTTAAVPRTIGVVELTPDGRHVRAYDADPALPGLAEAADPSQVAAVLGERECSVTPIRYRPGQRAVLRYDVGREVYFGKVLGSGAAELAAACTHLAGRADAGLVVPVPTAVVERLGLVVLPAVAGRALHALVFDPTVPLAERSDACRAAGQAVARLHGGAPPANRVAPLDDVSAAERAAVALHAIDPRVGEQWAGALATLAAVDAGEAEGVASHGALRTDQLLVTPEGPALLDLDGFCGARAARDLGNLLAYLRWRAMRRPEDEATVAAARDALLAGYADERDLPGDADMHRHEGLSLLKIAARRYRNLDTAEWPLVPKLVANADALGRAAS